MKTKNVLKIIFLFILPVLLFYFGFIPIGYTWGVLILVSIIVVGLTIKEGYTLRQLGIRDDNLPSSLIPYLIFTAVGIITIIAYAKFLGHSAIPHWWTNYHFTFLFLPISILQEFLYRGYLMPKLQAMFKSAASVIIANTLLFALLHTIYPRPEIMLPLALVGGLGFAVMYYRYPNLILISLAHSVLNFTAVLFAFFYHPK